MRNDVSLKEYLHDNSFNTDVYYALVEHKDFAGLFDPLEYLNYLYQQFDFFDETKENLYLIREHYDNIIYNEVPLVGLQRHFFLLTFINLIHYMNAIDLRGRFLNFSDVADRSYRYLEKMRDDCAKEFYPDEEPETIEELKNPISPIPSLIQEKVANGILDEEETPETNTTLRQKILVIKYLQQFKLLNLTTIHQDQTKQAQILSFLMGQISANTTRVALGEDISVLKTKKNLEAAQKLFEPLKEAFPQIVSQIEDDIKKLKK